MADQENAEYDLAPDSQFESFFETDSGRWTLRRVPTAPPVALPDDVDPEA